MIDSKLKPGMVVEHLAKPEWGRGRVISVAGDHVSVRFSQRDARGRSVGATDFDLRQTPLRLADDQSDPFPPGTAVPRVQRSTKSSSAPRPSSTLEALVGRFQLKYPGRFEDDQYRRNERDYKQAAHREAEGAFGGALSGWPVGEEFAKRVSAVVQRSINLLHTQEVIALSAALGEGGPTVERFRTALHRVVSDLTVTEGAMDEYFGAVLELPQVGKSPAATWPTATLLPFLVQPTRHMFLKPKVTKFAEASLGVDLNYKPQPRWLTYRCLLDMSSHLLERLRPLGARDFIDVYSFIWVTCGGYKDV